MRLSLGIGFGPGRLSSAPQYQSGAVSFDGNTRLENNALVATNNRYLSASFWANTDAMPTDVVGVVAISHPSVAYNNGFQLYRYPSGVHANKTQLVMFAGDSVNWVDFGYNYGNVNNPQVLWAGSSGWHHVMFTIDVTTRVATVYLDRVKQTLLNSVHGNPTTSQPNGLPYYIGDDLFDASYAGDLFDLWITTGVNFVSGSDIPEATLNKFVSPSGQPVSLGGDGSQPTGTPPMIYLRGGASSFVTNRGGGGAFAVDAGALTDAATSPSD